MSACGTRAGYLHHLSEGEPPCADCRRANTEYKREYRKRRPSVYAREIASSGVRSRALWRLADLHPGQFQALIDEEMAREESESRPPRA